MINLRALAVITCIFALFSVARAASVYSILDTISFVGDITPEDEQKVASILTTYEKGKIRRIRITSDGGSVKAALSIAKLIHKYKLELIVRRRCVSACALLLFPSASRRTVLEGAYLAFHEGTDFRAWQAIVTHVRSGAIVDVKGEAIEESELRAAESVIKETRLEVHDFLTSLGVKVEKISLMTELTSMSVEKVTVRGSASNRQITVDFKPNPSGCMYIVPTREFLTSSGILANEYQVPDRSVIAQDLSVSERSILILSEPSGNLLCK